jgi:hypothetical protein
MGQIIVEMKGADPWANVDLGADEAELVATLAKVAEDHEVVQPEAYRAEREAEAKSLMERLGEMRDYQRTQAVRAFEERYGPFGRDEISRLEWEIQRLAAEEEAERLLARLPQLSPSERIAEVEEYGRSYHDWSWEFHRLHRRLAQVDPKTAEAVPPRFASASALPGFEPEVLMIALPAVTGALANRVVGLAIDWLRKRAKRADSAQTVKLYGPDGKVIDEIRVSPTGSVRKA